MTEDYGYRQPTMKADRVLNGRYEVSELIGRGGMADVYLGRDVRLGRTVAIKVLRPDLARDPLFQSRFRREAQAVAGLNHQAIVSVYDTGDEVADNAGPDDIRLPFIVMEYVAGQTLRDLIKAGDITPRDAVGYMLGVLSALEYSHRAGIVHRDIKPANVMVSPHGQVKVMDFGIARAIADSAATMTQTQAVIGTAQYLSPEQARGETVDARSDLYSAGCLLYEMLTGRPPFIGDSPVSVAYQHVREQPPVPSSLKPGIPAQLDRILLRALAKDRNDRFQDAREFSLALEAAARGEEPLTAATEAIAVAPAQPVPEAAEEPQTRAMARVMAGGPLTSQSPVSEVDDDGSRETGAQAVPATRDRDPQRRDRRRAWVTTLLVLLALLLTAAGVLIYSLLTSAEPEPTTAPVPDVAGMTQTDAQNAITGAGFNAPMIEQDYHDTVESGYAIGTKPGGGTDAPLDGRITLLISQGPAEVTIPEDLIGMTEPQARDVLRSLGLQGGTTTTANSASVPEGRVLSSGPEPGTSVATGSTVDLVLSTGQVTLPDLVGMSRAQAEEVLANTAYQLTVTISEVENAEVPAGTVVDQSVAAGTDVPQGSSISLTVAKAPVAPSPSPSASPTPRGDDD